MNQYPNIFVSKNDTNKYLNIFVSTHCSETIFNSNVPQLAVFLQIIIFHIYMGYFIAFLKYFTEGRVKKCPFFDFLYNIPS